MSRRRPLIGVTGSAGRGGALWRFAALALALAGARARRLTPPLDARRLDGLDGLLIGGGDDIDAALSGAAPRTVPRTDRARDALELAALARFWPEGRPILGICRGAQMINVFRGGTLHGEVREAYGLERHPRTPLPLETIEVIAGTRLAAALGRERLRVNSLHHQAVDRLGADLRVSARDRHGIVQAIEAEGAPFRVGVQWHPELLPYRAPHRRLFAAFVAAARG